MENYCCVVRRVDADNKLLAEYNHRFWVNDITRFVSVERPKFAVKCRQTITSV